MGAVEILSAYITGILQRMLRRSLPTRRAAPDYVHANGLETRALTVSAGGLKSAVKRVREHPLIRLPNGTYYIFEAGNYSDGLQITFS